MVVELEYYEHGQLVAHPTLTPVKTAAEDSTESYFSILNSTQDSAIRAFRTKRWWG